MQNINTKDRLTAITKQAQRFFGAPKVTIKNASSDELLALMNQLCSAARYAFIFEYANAVNIPLRKRIRGYTRSLYTNMLEVSNMIDRVRVFDDKFDQKLVKVSVGEFRYWILVFQYLIEANTSISELLTHQLQEFIARQLNALSYQKYDDLVNHLYWTPMMIQHLSTLFVNAFRISRNPNHNAIAVINGVAARMSRK